MDFSYTPEEESFRHELREWLQENIPKGWGTADFPEFKDWREELGFQRAWQRKLYDGGWAGLGWPKEYGGREATIMEQVIFNEEMALANAPEGLSRETGPRLAGPTIVQHGTEEQKHRYLSKMMSGEELWCQGFSEPNAGSDLASLQMRAVEDGDDFVVTGQKVWTSRAHYADFCILLVRTDPSASKHRGISYLIADMRSPGITVRPLLQITGESNFNEVFFDEVRIPRTNLVGEKNRGWYVAITTLMFERSGTTTVIRFQRLLEQLIELAKSTDRKGRPASKDPLIRQKIAQLAVEVEVLKYNGYRDLTKQLRGQPPGPEGSIGKLLWSEMWTRMAEVALEILGPHSQVVELSELGGIKRTSWQYQALLARGYTIAAGTSEIQRNIIGDRVLGLPR